MISQNEIDELYTRLNIKNADMVIRNDINRGRLDSKLNTNYSAIYPDNECTIYSNGVREDIKI